MSTPNYPPIRLRKWYFAYHDVNGMVFPFAWAEDDGICVGGRPDYLQGSKVEISEEDFKLGLSILERIHRINLPNVLSPSIGSEPV